MAFQPPQTDLVNYAGPFRKVLETVLGKTPAGRVEAGMPGLGYGALKVVSPTLIGPTMAARQLLPERWWQYLTRHPKTIEVMEEATKLGGAAEYHTNPFQKFQRVRVAPGRGTPRSIGHELVHGVTDLAGRKSETFPGLAFRPEFLERLQRSGYQPWELGRELLPYYVSQPQNVQVTDIWKALRALEEWVR